MVISAYADNIIIMGETEDQGRKSKYTNRGEKKYRAKHQ